jgi:microcin C transport system substrate-binding protein
MKRFLWLGLVLAVCAGCGRKAQQAKATRDIAPEAEAYYKAHPDFFHFKTIDDLPKGLVWHDGHDVPTFADPEAKQGGTLNVSIEDFPRTLRTVGPDANSGIRPFILDDNALSLIEEQPNTGQYYPQLAKEWAYGADGRTMYFRLDPDARYSDGVPVKADDYLFIFFFFRTKYINDPWSNDFYTTYFTQITKFDDYTISVSCPDPKPDIEWRVGSLTPVPEHFYKELGPDFPQRYQWQFEPTTGPYMIDPEEINKGTSIDLVRVPDWWADQKPFFAHRFNAARYHLFVIRDTNKAFEAFMRGDVDIAGLGLPDFWYNKLADSNPLVQKGCVAKVTFYNLVPRPELGLFINCAQPLLNNRDIRQGIAYSANFDLVDRQYFRGDEVRMQTSADGYAEVPFPDIHPRPFSVEKALACFAKAGFTKRGADGILVDGTGRRLSFTITTGMDYMRDPLTIIRQEAAKAGLELNLEILEAEAAYKKIFEKHHQIAFLGFGIQVERYPRYWETFHSVNANKPQTNNLTNTADPKDDKLIDAYDKARTMDEIRRLANLLELRIRDDAAFIPAFERPYIRVGYWRWIKFPKDDFLAKISQDCNHYGLFWIDDDMRPRVQAALNGGPKLPVEIRVYDQWKQK